MYNSSDKDGGGGEPTMEDDKVGRCDECEGERRKEREGRGQMEGGS